MANDPTTTRYEIHPAIGIARLGDSNQFFFGPEPLGDDVSGWKKEKYDRTSLEPCWPEGAPAATTAAPPARLAKTQDYGAAELNKLRSVTCYRDNGHRLKRQAVRFRLYKVERGPDGRILNSYLVKKEEARITWKVRLANIKAAAPEFRMPHNPRNPQIAPEALTLDSKWQVIKAWHSTRTAMVLSGQIGPCPPYTIAQHVKGCDYEFSRSIPCNTVRLGEAYVDPDDRLVVVGPQPDNDWFWNAPHPCFPQWFYFDGYNNEGWYDNVSDGPVVAEIEEPGQPKQTATAWVVVAPFNFSPDLDPFVTLYDVAHEMACERGFPGFPRVDHAKQHVEVRTSFRDDILPLLDKSRQVRWVNGWSLQAETQDRHFWWNQSPSDDRFEGISKPTGHSSLRGAIEGEAWRKALFKHMRSPWSTASLALNKCETATLSVVLEWLADYHDDDQKNGPWIAEAFVQRHGGAHGFDALLNATTDLRNELFDAVKADFESKQAKQAELWRVTDKKLTPEQRVCRAPFRPDPRTPYLGREYLESAMAVVRAKRETLKDAFSKYRPVIMPRQVGDDYGTFSEHDWATRFSPDPLHPIEKTDRMLALTKVQYSHLENWSKGRFVEFHKIVDEAKPERNPTAEHYCDALTRVALEACNGGALYPGIEVWRIVRRKEIYCAAFRIAHATDKDYENRDVRSIPSGNRLCAGDLTSGLAVPWQNDFFECNMERFSGWWPASRPDNVFLHIPVDEVDSQGEELKSWTGQVLKPGIGWVEEPVNRVHKFIEQWPQLPVVVKKQVPPRLALVRPPTVWKDGEPVAQPKRTDQMKVVLRDIDEWTRWWEDSKCPSIEIQYGDPLYKREKRYVMSLRGTGPRANSGDGKDKRPYVGHVLDVTAVDEWERTRRPDIEYYCEDGKDWKRYFVYVADVLESEAAKSRPPRKS